MYEWTPGPIAVNDLAGLDLIGHQVGSFFDVITLLAINPCDAVYDMLVIRGESVHTRFLYLWNLSAHNFVQRRRIPTHSEHSVTQSPAISTHLRDGTLRNDGAFDRP